MSYEKRNFQSGSTLYASDLNLMDEQIYKNATEKIDRPSTGAVGQMIVVKAIDEDGKPTEFKAVNVPEVGSVGASQEQKTNSLFYTTQSLGVGKEGDLVFGRDSIVPTDIEPNIDDFLISQNKLYKIVYLNEKNNQVEGNYVCDLGSDNNVDNTLLGSSLFIVKGNLPTSSDGLVEIYIEDVIVPEGYELNVYDLLWIEKEQAMVQITSIEGNEVLYNILFENRVTAEQAQQIAKNTQDISELSGQIDELKQNGVGGPGTVVSSVEPMENDIPKVFIDGVIPTNKTEVLAELTYVSKTENFHAYLEIKCQGDSSLSYPKKNFTIKMFSDEARETKLKKKFRGWGEHNKYVLKANYIDHTHARNIVSAELWGEVVASRSDYDSLPQELRESPNNGAIEGFPIKVYNNGTYQGIYTWNIPKDDWLYGVDEDNPNQFVLYGQKNTDGVYAETANNFRKLWDGVSQSDREWEVEVGTNSDIVKTALNNVISLCMNADDETFKNTLNNYLDVQSALDYYIFVYTICALDSLAQNMILVSYDGTKLYCSAYDLDSTFGLWWNGQKFVSTSYRCPEDYQERYSLLWERIEKLFADELKERYAELRNSVLSLSNMFTRFERFMDIIGLELYAEDLSVYSGIPSGSTNNIKQIRNYIRDRLVYCDGQFEKLGEETDEPDVPEEPDIPEVTLSSISATYTGGEVTVGTALTDLTGITVTAHYSDGSTTNVTGYTLSGTIESGDNIITVAYNGKTTTFIVIGEEEVIFDDNIVDYSINPVGNLTWMGGSAYDANTGALNTNSPDSCTKKEIHLQNCLYEVIPSYQWSGFSIWGKDGSYKGKIKNASSTNKLYIWASSKYIYSAECGNATGDSKFICMPVDNSASAEYMEIDLANVDWMVTEGFLEFAWSDLYPSIYPTTDIDSSNYLMNIVNASNAYYTSNFISRNVDAPVFSFMSWQNKWFLRTNYFGTDVESAKAYFTTHDKLILNHRQKID